MKQREITALHFTRAHTLTPFYFKQAVLLSTNKNFVVTEFFSIIIHTIVFSSQMDVNHKFEFTII